MQVDESGQDEQTVGVKLAAGTALDARLDGNDQPAFDGDVGESIGARCVVDDSTALDHHVMHRQSPTS